MGAGAIGAWGLLGTWVAWFVYSKNNPFAGQDVSAVLWLVLGNLVFGLMLIFGLVKAARRQMRTQRARHTKEEDATRS